LSQAIADATFSSPFLGERRGIERIGIDMVFESLWISKSDCGLSGYALSDFNVVFCSSRPSSDRGSLADCRIHE
jgi:hypothetical protein